MAEVTTAEVESMTKQVEAPQDGEAEKANAKKQKNKKKKPAGEKPAGGEKEKSRVKAIKEQLAAIEKLKAEQQAEEERRIRELEEAERAREERERLEREKRERKKQKEREKREKKKQDGTLLTEQQKRDKRRLQELVEQQRAAGIDIPLPKAARDDQPGEVAPKKKPVYERKRKNVPNNANNDKQQPADAEAPTSANAAESAEPSSAANEEAQVISNNVKQQSQEEDDDSVKENWFDSGDSDDDSKAQSDSDNDNDNATGKATAAAKQSGSAEQADGADSETAKVAEPTYEDESLRRAAYERAKARIAARREAASSKRGAVLRAPVVCVLGHVDTGKTKLLDALRNTDVQAREAGGITQQIGATNVPVEALNEAIRYCKPPLELRVPGLLIIDTPGHESFSNLRSRGNSLCDIAVLVVDIMHGIQQQTLESLTLLRKRRTPFVIALNKIDRLYGWVTDPNADISDVLVKQAPNTRDEFAQRAAQVKLQLAEQGVNAALFSENPDLAEYISIVPTSAHTRDGLGNLLHTLCTAAQTRLASRVAASQELQASVMEVKAIPGLGTTCDVVLVNGTMREGDTIVLAGQDGKAIVTQVRGLLMTAPLRELRVKNSYEKKREVQAACGVKLLARDLERAMAGLPLLVAEQPDEIAVLRDELEALLASALSALKPTDVGVYVQASTLGSLEALVDYLKSCKVPYSGLSIGPVHKRDVMKASVMLERDRQWAVILAFDVKVEREAALMAEELGVRVFTARIIYHLFDALQKYRDELRDAKKTEFRSQAVFPCRLRLLPQFIFRDRDPIIAGVVVEAGVLVSGTPLCVVAVPKDKEGQPSAQKEVIELGRVASIEFNHKAVDRAMKGQEVCIKIDPAPGEAPRQYGRHFDDKDEVVSRVTRESIDILKEYFRDEMKTADWQVVIELKKILGIL